MSWIQTYTGKKFDLLHPKAEDVDIRDIAHALANQCRFNGHVRQHYSVAQHSVLVAEQVREEMEVAADLAMALVDQEAVDRMALYGLLHDAAEAYIGDMVAPLKPLIPSFKLIETSILCVVFERFGLEGMGAVPMAVDDVDKRLCLDEGRLFLSDPPEEWELAKGRDPLGLLFEAVDAAEAEAMFLEKFAELTGEAVQ